MKSKMRKKLIAFMLCMVLVICNSVSILADTPAVETTTAEKQVKETQSTKDESASEEDKTTESKEDTSKQSDKETAPETKTTEKKEETTEATTEKKEESTTEATTKAKEETTTADKKETTTTEEGKETSEASDKKSTEEEKSTEIKDEENAVTELTYENDDVIVTVSEVAEGAIPEGAELKVVPILKDDTETQAQYTEVEQKIQEKAAETETEIKGFLAYDITFVDEDGNEIEPNSEVKVSMEYRKAAIPAELSEEDAKNTEVSVMHLEEDADGNVSQVVDMGEAGKIDTLETTDAKQVEKVEVKTESFSTFTIYWGYYGYLAVQVVDSSGNSIGSDDDTSLWSTEARTVAEIAEEINVPEGYIFSEAKIGGNFNSANTEVARIRYNSDRWRNEYSTKSLGNNNWQSIGYQTIYFIYTYQASDLGTINTVDSKSAGITLNLFDYSTGTNYTGGINSGKDFKFTNGSSETNTDVNTYHSGGGENAVFDGIFEKNMAKSGDDYTYPLFNDSYNGGQDASYLFAPTDGTGKVAYPNVNHLFTKDSDGYYRYDSSKNFAYYNKSGGNAGNFTVYDVPAAPNGTEDVYMKGSFFPFNVLANNSTIKDTTTGLRDFTTGEGGTQKNTHFGMTMSASFVQPAEGKVNGQNMVFNFNGDDDVWVFIDGVLVLDIGGIHDALDGSIDFNTGKVTVTGQPETTLKALFEAANRDTNTGFNGNTFADYTDHTINFYYLERGEGTSNCKLEFNIQTVPTDKVIVEKQLGIAGLTTDDKFTFKAETSANGKNWTALKEGTSFIINNTDGTGSTSGTIGSNGEFTLEPGQRAEFSDITAGTYFRVFETRNSEYNTSIQVYGQDYVIDNDNLSGQLIVREGVNQIVFVNTPNSSSQLLNKNKTAKVEDYENRVYKVDLSAGAIGSTAGSEGESASIVLCLDASSSLGSAFDDVQDAAKDFIAVAANKVSGVNSGNIEIAVVWYQGTQGSSTDKTSSSGFKDVKQNAGDLNDFIDSKKSPSGGTPMGDALDKAESLLKNNAQYSNKYVLLFTDGLPGYNSSDNSFNCMVANDAYNHASSMKNAGTIIYTVGYGSGLDGELFWTPGHSANTQYGHGKHDTETSGENFLSQYIASENCAFITDDITELSEIFTNIAGSVGSNVTMDVENIKDVVDERFNLLVPTTENDSERIWQDTETQTWYRIAKASDIITDSEGNSGTVTYDENTRSYTITWSKVTIPNVNDDDGWSASFYVKAKEDFIGGNMIPTNGSESGIYVTDDDVVKFPMPTVNVKLLTLHSENKEVTYFKGETVTPQNFIQELLNTAEVVELVNDSTDEKVTISVSDLVGTLTDGQLTSLITGNSVNVDYKYGTTNDIVGKFTLQFAVQNNKGQLAAHRLDQSGNAVERYVLTVTYTAKSLDERQSITTGKGLSTPGADAGTVVTNNISTNSVYTVNVVAGSMTVRKTLSVADLRAALEASDDKKIQFTFTINGTDRYNPDQPYLRGVTITFDESDLEKIDSNATEITKEATVVSDLAQDIYTVSENSVNGFEAQSVVAGGLEANGNPIIETKINDTNKTANLYVGLPKAEATGTAYLGYRDGVVIFTNSKVIANWQIVKVSSTGHEVKLGGAEFELVSTSASDKKYTGTSAEETGIIIWKENGVLVNKIDAGTYTLSEKSAPSGYKRSTLEWTVEITSSGALKSIEAKDGTPMETDVAANGLVSYFYENEVVYDLPSAGGPGIYWYTLSGTLLMAGAALIVYRQKRKREVLLRK
ncbi:fibro-slime domain-containing protein [Eubacterium sp. An11]|uniref:fibro-slime domain-containing protein n=1 Tax=Eubacterium sp. An11 TaxID=1965542 RepID=UPI0013A65154|nr:fibro-slime domain-containing protein [Eubacterium sp. An11]